jgi:transposase
LTNSSVSDRFSSELCRWRKLPLAIRLVITDAVGAEREPGVRTIKHDAGSPPQLGERLVLEAVLYQARTGIPGRDLPGDFGHWEAVSNRLRRWEARHLWKSLWHHGQPSGGELAHQGFIASTLMRAHRHAAGARKNTVAKKPRLLAALGADFPPNDRPPVPMNPRGSACS